MHIVSWVLTIVLYIIAFYTFQNHKDQHQLLNHYIWGLESLCSLHYSRFWELIEEFMAASHGEGGNHMLLTLKMLCGLGVVALMEVSLAKRKNMHLVMAYFGQQLF